MKALTLALLVMLTACAPETVWRQDYIPLTPEERTNVARCETEILAATPKSLSGNDQDWDDAIREAHRVALETWCEPRIFEFGKYGRMTGRWVSFQKPQAVKE